MVLMKGRERERGEKDLHRCSFQKCASSNVYVRFAECKEEK
jgi:hypothetical protein